MNTATHIQVAEEVVGRVEGFLIHGYNLYRLGERKARSKGEREGTACHATTPNRYRCRGSIYSDIPVTK